MQRWQVAGDKQIQSVTKHAYATHVLPAPSRKPAEGPYGATVITPNSPLA